MDDEDPSKRTPREARNHTQTIPTPTLARRPKSDAVELGHSDDLLVIEMGLVVRPFLLDFGKAYVDRVPPYFHDEEIMAEWARSGRERFGKRWPKVLAVVRALRDLGIYYLDVSPSNIMFGDSLTDEDEGNESGPCDG